MSWLRVLLAPLLLCYSFAALAGDSPGRAIEVKLTLAPELQKYQEQSWTMYVFAKPPNGRVPLASKTLKLNQVPMTVKLDESMYLLENLTLATAEEVVVAVKVTRHNDPHKTMVGDLTALSPVIRFADGDRQQIALVIDTEVQ